MMKKILLAIMLISLSCKKDTNKCSHSESSYLQAFLTGNEDNLPPANPFIYFYIRLADDKVMEVSNNALQHLYDTNYHNKIKSDEFLCLLYGEHLFIDKDIQKKYEQRCIIVEINKNIINLSAKQLVDQFCIMKSNKLLLKSDLSDNIKISVLYKLFQSQYYISFDDSTGYYIISKHL